MDCTNSLGYVPICGRDSSVCHLFRSATRRCQPPVHLVPLVQPPTPLHLVPNYGRGEGGAITAEEAEDSYELHSEFFTFYVMNCKSWQFNCKPSSMYSYVSRQFIV